MCLFSRAVERVSGTRIFARPLGDGRQAIAYAMTLATREPVAMVLPLPVAPGSGEDAVHFVDLSGYPDFFTDLDGAFPEPSRRSNFLAASRQATPLAMLEVHPVGDFVASYVPTPRDFERLDPRFRLPAGALAAHAEYADWGFAVFQLAAADATPPPKRRWFWQKARPPVVPGAAATIHPMAFTFPSRRPRALFFPTLHLHDGAEVPARATYDHALYCQSDDPVLTRTFAWRPSDHELGTHVRTGRTGGLVDPDLLAYRYRLVGDAPNVDHWFEPPRCAGETALAHRGAWFAFDLAATAAYDTDLTSPRSQRWHHTARARLDELHAGLVAGLDALVAAHGDAWGLVDLPADADAYHVSLSNDQPHAMTERGPVPLVAGTGGTCVVSLHAQTEHVERQNVRFAFAATPSVATIRVINAALAAILEGAIS